MRAFLSHSSKDKGIVGQVFDQLGSARTVYDADTFEEGRQNAAEIERWLSRTDLFVLFLSQNALTPFVKSEIRIAFEKWVSGRIKEFIVFSLDGTSYKELPDGLQSIIVERNNSPSQIARRIRSKLIELDASSADRQDDIFVGRAEELTSIQRSMSLPTSEMSPVFAISGWPGIGRRTLAQRAIRNTYPQLKTIQPLVVLDDNDALSDVHRKLYDIAYGVAKTT